MLWVTADRHIGTRKRVFLIVGCGVPAPRTGAEHPSDANALSCRGFVVERSASRREGRASRVLRGEVHVLKPGHTDDEPQVLVLGGGRVETAYYMYPISSVVFRLLSGRGCGAHLGIRNILYLSRYLSTSVPT